jgi:hypothetical protein
MYVCMYVCVCKVRIYACMYVMYVFMHAMYACVCMYVKPAYVFVYFEQSPYQIPH